MAVAVRPYPTAQQHFWAGSIDWDAHDIYIALLDADGGFVDTDEFWADLVSDEIPNGGGYTTNGVILGSKTNVKTDSSALTAWAASTVYVAGDVRRATTDNGHVFRCTVPGTSFTAEPTWNLGTLRETSEGGGTVRWVEFGAAVVVLSAANPSWGPGATITGIRFGAIYERTSGSDGARKLIAHLDFGQTEQVTNGTFTITIPASGLLRTGLGSPT